MRRPALALLLGCLLLVAGASALDGYDYYQTIEYAGCDQDIYQQDIVIHRSTGTAYNETAGGLETWHIFVGEHCQEDYGDVRFTNSTGAELAYYLWPDFDSSSARFAVRLEGATSAGQMQVWYGNPTATTTSDSDSVFIARDLTKFSEVDPHSNLAINSDKEIQISGLSSKYDAYVYKEISERTTGRIDLTVYRTGGALKVNGFGVANSLNDCRAASPGAFVIYPYSSYFMFWIDGSMSNAIAASADNVPKYVTLIYNGTNVIFSVYSDAARTTLLGTKSAAWSSPWKYIYAVSSFNDGSAASISGYIRDFVARAYSATPPAALTFSGEQEIAAPPTTAFTATPAAGLTPLTVQFTDTSAGSPTSWLWSFGDGNTSTAQNPQHTYTVPGTYSVTLTATNEYGSTPATKLDYITVYAPINAQFTASPTGGTAPVTVQFTDTSAGSPTSWLWSFGDGNTSTDQNPAHTYTTAGTHTVALTASHPYDSDTETKTSYIIVAVLQPFPGLALIPRDLTGSGLYTDINGNNRLDYNDLTIFFQNLAWAKTAQPIACFDFNGNGWLDYNDVITLFSTIMEEHT